MSLEFGTQEGRVALFLRSLHKMEEFIVGPITANYPNCSLTIVEPNEPCPSGRETWTADLELAPELFPILRHITRSHGWLPAWILDVIAAATEEPIRMALETSTSRQHDREDDLQAAL